MSKTEFSIDFKPDVVHQIVERGYPVAAVCKRLRIGQNSRHTAEWRRKTNAGVLIHFDQRSQFTSTDQPQNHVFSNWPTQTDVRPYRLECLRKCASNCE